jgi:hypothetical protein
VLAADVLFVGTPHTMYKTLTVPPTATIIDVWNILPPRGSATPV